MVDSDVAESQFETSWLWTQKTSGNGDFVNDVSDLEFWGLQVPLIREVKS